MQVLLTNLRCLLVGIHKIGLIIPQFSIFKKFELQDYKVQITDELNTLEQSNCHEFVNENPEFDNN